MKDQLHRNMLEAIRVTRNTRIGRATALLIRMLRTGSARPNPDFGRSRHSDLPHRSGTAAQPAMLGSIHGLLGRLGRIGARLGTAGLRKKSDRAALDEQFITGSYTNQAGHRAYKLYIPTGYRGKAVPLIVMLHGCTQSPDDFATGTRMNLLAEENTVLVVYPAQSVSANASKCWNWFIPDHQNRGKGEPSLIAGITRRIMQDYAIDPRRIYIAGLSAGAAAASVLAKTYPDLYAAVGVHSGLAPGAANNVASARLAMQQGKLSTTDCPGNIPVDAGLSIVPTIVFHGDQDSKVHPRNGEHVLKQSGAARRLDLETKLQQGQVPNGHRYTRTLYLDTSGCTVMEQWIIHGLGHAWSGGSPAGSYTDPRGPDAARQMFRFFLQHTHGSPTSNRWSPYGL